MVIEPWFAIGYKLVDGAKWRKALFGGSDWQIAETEGKGRALVVKEELYRRWTNAGLIADNAFIGFPFGDRQLWSISSGSTQQLCPVNDGKSPGTKVEALSFAKALKATREIDRDSPLQDALYVEKITRLLPTFSISSRVEDDVVLGYWLTGGAPVSAKGFRRLHQMLSWLGRDHLKDVINAAGVESPELTMSDDSQKQLSETTSTPNDETQNKKRTHARDGAFNLAGRPELTAFFNEHVIDLIKNEARYKALGIGFPSAMVLFGPPGCGKTYAVDELINYLGWPSFRIDSSSVGSPYIHQTSMKIAQVFDKAIDTAPSVLVIDEMEAFLSERDAGAGPHRIEEVAEFLRRIPEANKSHVLIIAMTNRIEMIDSAILRRGRFDHVIKVDYASESEVASLLDHLLSEIPRADEIDANAIAKQLINRPLSDVAFVVREAARIAARLGLDRINQASILSALKATSNREDEARPQRRIGFV